VDVADVVVVLDRRMSAPRSVLVGVIFMEFVLAGTLASPSQAFEAPNPIAVLHKLFLTSQDDFYAESSSLPLLGDIGVIPFGDSGANPSRRSTNKNWVLKLTAQVAQAQLLERLLDRSGSVDQLRRPCWRCLTTTKRLTAPINSPLRRAGAHQNGPAGVSCKAELVGQRPVSGPSALARDGGY
jgi:hypothetical protein